MTTPKLLTAQHQQSLFGDELADAPTIDRAQLAGALADLLTGMSLDGVVAIMTNKYRELIEYMQLTQGAQTCQRMSLLFNPHRLEIRATPHNNAGRSIIDGLRKPGWHDNLARATLFKLKQGVSIAELFYYTMQVGVGGTQWANEFPPHVARDIFKAYGINSSSRVLDPCGGWGGRMIGASVCANSYTCYEPSTRTAHGLTELAKFIASIKSEFVADVHCEPYEDSSERAAFYDFALTSPPYYDTELYSDEDTNSCNRYKTFDDWCAGFYLPMLDKTMRQLKPHAAFVFNVGDRRYPLSTVLRDHAQNRYALRTMTRARLVNNSGFGKEYGGGEKFYELKHNE